MYLRSEQRRQRAFRLVSAISIEPSSTSEADARLDARALGPALSEALADLSPDQREALLLHAWAGLSNAEIADALSVSSATVWIGADGFARLVQRGDEVLLFHPSSQQIQAERELQNDGSHLQVLAYSQPYRWVDLDYQQLVHLPTNPAALRRWIERHAIGSGSHDDKVANYTGALLQQAAPLPPQLSAAFYRVIARLPGPSAIARCLPRRRKRLTHSLLASRTCGSLVCAVDAADAAALRTER